MAPPLSLVVPAGAFLATGLAALALREAVAAPPAAAADPSIVAQPAEQPRPVRWAASLAEPADPWLQDRDRTRLLQAGWTDPSALAWWYLTRAVLTVAAPVGVGLLGADPLTPRGAITFFVSALAGYYLPLGVVALTRAARQARLQQAVPNLLDMLVSCLEAGLGTDAALRHVAREIRVASDELADELDRANGEMSAGTPRHEALRKLDRRTGVPELSALVGVLGQAERFGAGVAPSLRAHAQLARRQRALRAEQRAARASPTLTVVMILFILPALFVVLLGPTIVQVVTHFLPTLSAGA